MNNNIITNIIVVGVVCVYIHVYFVFNERATSGGLEISHVCNNLCLIDIRSRELRNCARNYSESDRKQQFPLFFFFFEFFFVILLFFSQNGTFLGAISLATMLCFAGFLILFTDMSRVMYAISYLSYLSYGFQSLTQSIYGYNRENIPCPEDVEYCQFRSPTNLLKELGMTEMNFLNNVLCLCGNVIILKIIGFCTLRRKIANG